MEFGTDVPIESYSRTSRRAPAATIAKYTTLGVKPVTSTAKPGVTPYGIASGATQSQSGAARRANMVDALLDVPVEPGSYLGEPDWGELEAQDRQYRSWADSITLWRMIAVFTWATVIACGFLTIAPIVSHWAALLGGAPSRAPSFGFRAPAAILLATVLFQALFSLRLRGVTAPSAPEPLGHAFCALLRQPARAAGIFFLAPLLVHCICYITAAAAETPVVPAAPYTPVVSASTLPVPETFALPPYIPTRSPASPAGFAPGATVSPAPPAHTLWYLSPSARLYKRVCVATARGAGSLGGPVPDPAAPANAAFSAYALEHALPVAATETDGVALQPLSLNPGAQLSLVLALLLGLGLALRGALCSELALDFAAPARRRGRLARLLQGAGAVAGMTVQDLLLLAAAAGPLALMQDVLLPRLLLLLQSVTPYTPMRPSFAALAAEPASDLFAALLSAARSAATAAAKAALESGASPSSAAATAVHRVIAAAPAAVGGPFAAVVWNAVALQEDYAAAAVTALPTVTRAAAMDAALRARVFAPLLCGEGYSLFYVPHSLGLDALGGLGAVLRVLALLGTITAAWHMQTRLLHVILTEPLRFGRYLLKGLTDSQDRRMRHLAAQDLVTCARFDERARSVIFSRLDGLPLWPACVKHAKEEHARLTAAAASAAAAGTSVAAFASQSCLTTGDRRPALWRAFHDVLLERTIHNTTRKIYRHLFEQQQAALARHLALARAAAMSVSGAAPPSLERITLELAAGPKTLRERLWKRSPRERLRAVLADHALVAAAVDAAVELVIAARAEDFDNAVGAAKSAQALADALAQLELALGDLESSPTAGLAQGVAAGPAASASGALRSAGGAAVGLVRAPPRTCPETALLALAVRSGLHRLLAAYRERDDEWVFAPAVGAHLDAYLRYEL